MAALHRQSGQALIESCVVIGILCLLLMGLLQLSQLYMAQEILHYAAGRGARARAVGFNDFMVFKTVRASTIANAGPLTSPTINLPAGTPLTLRLGQRFRSRVPVTTANGPSAQGAIERARIPLYLGANWHSQLRPILDYEDWPGIDYTCQEEAATLTFRVSQHFPLKFLWHRLFYADDHVALSGTVTLDNHYPLYMAAE